MLGYYLLTRELNVDSADVQQNGPSALYSDPDLIPETATPLYTDPTSQLVPEQELYSDPDLQLVREKGDGFDAPKFYEDLKPSKALYQDLGAPVTKQAKKKKTKAKKGDKKLVHRKDSEESLEALLKQIHPDTL